MLPRPGGSGKSKDDSSMAAALEVVIVHSPASKEQRLIGGQESASSGCCRRKRNNATQTKMEGGSCCCVITTHHHHCHCNHHRHHHHHCHYRSSKRRALLHQKRSHRHHNLQVKQSNHKPMLPSNQNNNNKSSLDSSEEAMHHQAIAIEIDAATMSEDGEENNSSTATSNFPYKVASEGVKPIIMAPLREQHRHRRGSLNSNTTIETDELSHDDDDDDDDDVRMGSHHLPEDEAQLTQPAITNSSSSSTKRGNPASAPARNECVRIKRKRFIAEAGQDYCSSCSSSCSCSSLDEDLEAHREMTVSAECHQCVPGSRRASFCSCHNSSCCCGSCSPGDEEDDEEEEADDEDDETTGQRESFCTAADHTITPSQEGDDMHSSTLTPLSTQRSSFMDQDHGDHTMRSDNGGGNLTDADASSLSQSAEYFSLSSTAGGAASFPIKEEDKADKPEKREARDAKDREVEPPSCKHWSRNPHGKHKRGSSPVDNSL